LIDLHKYKICTVCVKDSQKYQYKFFFHVSLVNMCLHVSNFRKSKYYTNVKIQLELCKNWREHAPIFTPTVMRDIILCTLYISKTNFYRKIQTKKQQLANFYVTKNIINSYVQFKEAWEEATWSLFLGGKLSRSQSYQTS